MFGKLRNIFRRFRKKGPLTLNPEPLTINGIAPAPLTPEPDDAELAAEAFLNSKCKIQNSKLKKAAPKGSREYYEQLAEKIKAAHEQERRAAMRYVAYCEGELDNSKSKIQNSKLAELERGLFKWQDAVEREQGDLLKRWQHCLADITIRLMTETTSNSV